jgi:hypothetical protein
MNTAINALDHRFSLWSPCQIGCHKKNKPKCAVINDADNMLPKSALRAR